MTITNKTEMIDDLYRQDIRRLDDQWIVGMIRDETYEEKKQKRLDKYLQELEESRSE